MRQKYPEVEIYYPPKRDGSPGNLGKGLVVEGVIYSWKEVERRWGFSRTRFMRRVNNHPHWDYGKVLKAPLQMNGEGPRELRMERQPQKTMAHPEEELWRNEVACSKWY